MKFRHWFTAAATAAIAALAAPAFAGIGAGDDPEVFALVYDDARGTYIIDFNVTMSQLFALTSNTVLGTTVGSANWASYVAADGNLNDFSPFDGTRFALIAIDSNGSLFGGDAEVTYLTTSTGNVTPVIDNLSLDATINSMGQDYVAAVNFNGMPAGIGTKGDVFAANSTPADFVESVFGGSFGLYAGNAIGTTNSIYTCRGTAASTGDPFAQASCLQQQVRISFDGTNFTAVAVPEPGTMALWLAGLGFVGQLAARRRKR